MDDQHSNSTAVSALGGNLAIANIDNSNGFTAHEGSCVIVREPLRYGQSRFVYFSDVPCVVSQEKSAEGLWDEVRRYEGARFVIQAKIVPESSQHPLGVSVVNLWAADETLQDAAAFFASALMVGVSDDPDFLLCTASLEKAAAWVQKKFRITWTPKAPDRLRINGNEVLLRTDYPIAPKATPTETTTEGAPAYHSVDAALRRWPAIRFLYGYFGLRIFQQAISPEVFEYLANHVSAAKEVARRCRIIVIGGDMGGQEESGVVYVGPKNGEIEAATPCFSYHCRTSAHELQSRALGGDPGCVGRSNISHAPHTLDADALRFFGQMVNFHQLLAKELPKQGQRYRWVPIFPARSDFDSTFFDSAFGSVRSTEPCEEPYTVRLESAGVGTWSWWPYRGRSDSSDLVSGNYVRSHIAAHANGFADHIASGDLVDEKEFPLEVMNERDMYQLRSRRAGFVVVFLKGRAFLQNGLVYVQEKDLPCDILIARPNDSLSEPLRLQLSIEDGELRQRFLRFSREAKVLMVKYLLIRI